jgi:3alpha(or 20beta)-hydroxysteroid dehydrogenase
MGRVDGRVAIVTGAARGMGAAHARALVREGANVLLTDLLEDEGREVARELGEHAQFAAHDVTSEASWERILTTAENVFGDVGILVNNAGVAVGGPIEETAEAMFRRIIDVNEVGVFLGMKAVIGSMRRAGGGSIVNISSVGGLIGEPNTIAYTASKFAVTGMTKVAAKELATHGIRVNSVHPGFTDTPMLQLAGPAEVLREFASATPLGRFGRPEEVSAVVVFLASDESAFVTGSGYVVDGGLMR